MRIIGQITEYFSLIFIGIINLIYNTGIFFVELFYFGSKSWWWRLNYQYFLHYLFTNTNRLIRQESSTTGYPDENFIYGETPCITVRNMIKISCRSRDCLFIDLGCGRGRTVFYYHFLTGSNARGYEIIPTFTTKAERIREKLRVKDVEFINMDILDADISDACLVYVAGTTFSDKFTDKLNNRLQELPEGTVIITLSSSLPSTSFEQFEKKKMFLSWGKSTVYFHRKK
jgi:SAM-dependent methyltransferase